MPSALGWYAGAVGGAALVLLVVALALALMQLSAWIDAHPRTARRYGVRYGWANVGVLVALWALGYVPMRAAALAGASTAYTVYALASDAAPTHVAVLGAAWCLPLGAHWSLVAYYARAQAAWAAHLYGLAGGAPALPRATPHEVVALLAGTVWALPLYHVLCLTTERLALPTQTDH